MIPVSYTHLDVYKRQSFTFSFSQSGSYGSTFVFQGAEVGIYGQHNFQANPSGTISAGIIGSERTTSIGVYSFIPPLGSWISASNSGFVDGYVRTYRTDGFVFPIGDGNNYRPAAVSAASMVSPATAAYYGVNPTPVSYTHLYIFVKHISISNRINF